MKMKKIILFLLFLSCSHNGICQSDSLYLFIEKPIFGESCDGYFGTGFAIKSEDKRFLTNFFKFEISNIKSFNESGGFDYFQLKDLLMFTELLTLKFR